MRGEMMLVRTLTAAVLFTVMAQANIWTSTSAHLILAVGYRFFLLAAPFFMFIGIGRGMNLALLLCLMGLAACFWRVDGLPLGIFALGMAVSGYIAKSVAAHSSQGAADNKVSLNIGSLISGSILMLMTDKTLILTLASILVVAAAWLSYRIPWAKIADDTPLKTMFKATSIRSNWDFKLTLGWSLIGIATGIKLTGIFVILPQYLLQKLGSIPGWYGSIVMINSVIIIFAQHRIMKILDGRGIGTTMTLAVSTMVLLALPSFMAVEHMLGAGLWIALLTVGECALSAYDRMARVSGYLFPKELMVGIGSFLTVFFTRHVPEMNYLSGVVGILCFLAGSALVGHMTKKVPVHAPFQAAN